MTALAHFEVKLLGQTEPIDIIILPVHAQLHLDVFASVPRLVLKHEKRVITFSLNMTEATVVDSIFGEVLRRLPYLRFSQQDDR